MKTLGLFLLGFLASVAAHAAGISGDWMGTLKVGPSELRLELHITDSGKGAWTATLDSPDQNSLGIPVSSIAFADPKLTLQVEAIHGSYEGTLSSDGQEIHGTWTQGQPLPLDFKRDTGKSADASKPATPSDIDGDWQGLLDTGALKLRLIFHFTNMTDGLKATVTSPDQTPTPMPATGVKREGASITVELKQAGAKFEGKVSTDLTTIDGTFTQGGTLPLVLHRVKNAAELERRRPQNPVKPYPYHAEDVAYENKTAGITLAATLTVPQGKGPFPAAILITGSGPQDRDESLMGHKPFLVLADYLTRKGIAVLRADDRGTAKSGGNFKTATTADFATDTEAGVAFLKTRPEVDAHKIGLIGHSEGAVVAPMIAARNHSIAFIVMLAGTGVPGDQVIEKQQALIATAHGVDQKELEKNVTREHAILKTAEEGQPSPELEAKIKQQLSTMLPEAQAGMQAKALSSPWIRYFLTYDPAPALRKVTCPVLAVDGSKDLQVSPEQNLPAIRRALTEGGNKNFEVDELPGLNHLFQTAPTGMPSEYADIEETISPVVLKKIADWIVKVA